MLSEESLIRYFLTILLLEIIKGQCFSTAFLGESASGRATEPLLKKERETERTTAVESVPLPTCEQKETRNFVEMFVEMFENALSIP